MTKRSVKIRFALVMVFYGLVIVGAILIRVFDSTEEGIVYSTFEDLIPLLIAIPAVWLGHTLQRRNSYLSQLRTLWSNLIEAVQSANQYMHIDQPTHADFARTMQSLSTAIDEVRGVFKNIGEKPGDIGLYPFEPIKQIHNLLLDAKRREPLDESERKKVRDQIFIWWRAVRQVMLREFDREEPTYYHSHYADAIENWPPSR